MHKYLQWAKQADYEKRRLFQFQAFSTFGTVVLGLAAIWISLQQNQMEKRTREDDKREQRAKGQQEEIVRASNAMRSLGIPAVKE